MTTFNVTEAVYIVSKVPQCRFANNLSILRLLNHRKQNDARMLSKKESFHVPVWSNNYFCFTSREKMHHFKEARSCKHSGGERTPG